MSNHRPFYRFAGRRHSPDNLTDRLIFRNDHPPHDTVETSEWAFWELWRYLPMNAAHPRSIYYGKVDR
jgi:hypothetical protein